MDIVSVPKISPIKSRGHAASEDEETPAAFQCADWLGFQQHKLYR